MSHPEESKQLLRQPAGDRRTLRSKRLSCDLTIVGGGIAGVCCAITAARKGLKVVLVNDRPVLGGNASSEVRLWILGATSHMGNNNRWAREGGVIDELLVENVYRNREGNPILFDLILLEKVKNEPNIQLLLNTCVSDIKKSEPNRIESVLGFCSQNSTHYEISSPLFCDASGDGIVGFLSGAAFRMGAESSDEFGEKLAPDEGFGWLLGHSLYFYTKDIGRPVKFVPPSFALSDITEIPRYRKFNANDHGCHLWWIEYGGRLDTVHDTEEIKWELWRIVYGVWNHIKNSGEFPEAETLALEWVGQIPGKRESRRFEGDYMLTQQDIVEQRTHFDAVSYGGWAIDLHPADGVFSDRDPCNQWHSKGIYQIPYRSLYSRNMSNLFLAGRLISASHIAFGSTRVMATCGHNAQAVAIAATLCKEHGLLPKQLGEASEIERLQAKLQRTGQFIPQVVQKESLDLAQTASITASSQLKLDELKPSGDRQSLTGSAAMILPMRKGLAPKFSLSVSAAKPTDLLCELRGSEKPGNFTPEVILARKVVRVGTNNHSIISTPHSKLRPKAVSRSVAGEGRSETNGSELEANSEPIRMPDTQTSIELDFEVTVDRDRYLFLCLHADSEIQVDYSESIVTGMLAVRPSADRRVAESNIQTPPENSGIDRIEFYCPMRRPTGKSLAFRCDPPLDSFRPENVINGIARPTDQPNAWVADWNDPSPRLTLAWPEAQTIRRIELSFDTDFDHAMESVLMRHAEEVMPTCVQQFRILDDAGRELAYVENNYQTRRTIEFEQPENTKALHIEIEAPSTNVPAALFEVRCFAE